MLDAGTIRHNSTLRQPKAGTIATPCMGRNRNRPRYSVWNTNILGVVGLEPPTASKRSRTQVSALARCYKRCRHTIVGYSKDFAASGRYRAMPCKGSCPFRRIVFELVLAKMVAEGKVGKRGGL